VRIALDTVYATVGKKPTLFRLLVEAVISGHNEAGPAEERDYGVRSALNPTPPESSRSMPPRPRMPI
jgi:hypothetical protein